MKIPEGKNAVISEKPSKRTKNGDAAGVAKAEVGTVRGRRLIQPFANASPGMLSQLPVKQFGLTRNPFSVEYVSSDLGLLTSLASRVLSELRGWARSPSRLEEGALLVGAEGTGKAMVLQALVNERGEDIGGGSAPLVDAGVGRTYTREGEDDAYQSVLLRDVFGERTDRDAGLRVFVNADWMIGPRPGPRGCPMAGGIPPSTVLGISHSTYVKAARDGALPSEARVFFLAPQPEEREIERRLRASVRTCSESGDPFDPEAYALIASASLGLPGLAADLAHASLWTSGWVGSERVTKFIVDRVAASLYYDAAGALLARRRQFRGMTMEILAEALDRFHFEGEVRRNDLFRAFGSVPSSTLNHHLQRVTKERFFVEERYGHRVRYEIPKPVRAAIELLLPAGEPLQIGVNRLPSGLEHSGRILPASPH